MKTVDGSLVFESEDEFTLRLPTFSTEELKVVAVRAERDSDICYDCALYSYCRGYKGVSPFARHCYTTIFKEKK